MLNSIKSKWLLLFLGLICGLMFVWFGGLSVNAQQTSIKISILPLSTPTPPRSGGGGGGGGGTRVTTSVIFTGNAYPMSKVVILKDGQLAVSTIAGPDGKFNVTLSGISSGNYVFSVYGEDEKGRRSSLFTFPVFITRGATTQVSGIFLPPTISVDKKEVVKGDNISIFGQSKPDGDITISVNSPQEFFLSAKADKNGVYLYNFDTSLLEMGDHLTKSKVAKNGEISNFSNAVGFKVGVISVSADPGKCSEESDLNDDCYVNLLDYSIMAFWYLRQEPPEYVDLNKDGRVDLVDFSILAYHWTG